MIRRSSCAIVLALGLVAGCTEPASESGLSVDYVLTSTDPAAQNHTDVLLRYEDDWLPGTCVGITRRFDATRVVIEWSCNYETNAGTTSSAPFTGVLHDDDGDGTFVGEIFFKPLPDIDSTTIGPFRLSTFTMTPLP